MQQNKAIRALYNLPKRTSLLPYYKKANILQIDHLVELSLLKISYRYTNDILPVRIANLFEIPDHGYFTRNRNAFRIPHHTQQIYHKCFLAKAPHLWLLLPVDMKNKTSVKSFSRSFVKFKVNSL